MAKKKKQASNMLEVQNAAKTLFANIRFMSPDNPIRSIVMTSSVPNEGKSTCSVELARAIATSGKTVLLVEADMRRRTSSLARRAFRAGGRVRAAEEGRCQHPRHLRHVLRRHRFRILLRVLYHGRRTVEGRRRCCRAAGRDAHAGSHGASCRTAVCRAAPFLQAVAADSLRIPWREEGVGPDEGFALPYPSRRRRRCAQPGRVSGHAGGRQGCGNHVYRVPACALILLRLRRDVGCLRVACGAR